MNKSKDSYYYNKYIIADLVNQSTHKCISDIVITYKYNYKYYNMYNLPTIIKKYNL